jgi:acyl dehydratase
MPKDSQPSASAAEVPPRPVRADGLWLDDLTAGYRFTSDAYELSAAEITEFAARFDPQAFHTDPAAAKGTFFDGLAASGWHTAAVTMRLLVPALPIATGIVGAGGEVTWPSAARPGDVLHVEGVIDDIVASRSRPGRATLLVSHQTLSQHGEVRQKTSARLIAWNRPAPG